MKALILAAGLGTRLRPYTHHTPKPLFSIGGRPLLDITIENLIDAGCEAIMINTHHLHRRIEEFLDGKTYPVPIQTRHEPVILGTGGAIKNVADFWDERPFLVVNADIVSNIGFFEVYDFHCRHDNPVTLVLYDDPEINSVSINARGCITGFGGPVESDSNDSKTHLTFTGIQVLNPEILDYIPADVYSSSIDVFKRMQGAGKKIQAFVCQNNYWKDIGTPERYKEVANELSISQAFEIAYPDNPTGSITRLKLKGDGSERCWYRLISDHETMVMVDHGITAGPGTYEIDSFLNIGRHLRAKGIPVPRIQHYDRFAGLVFIEDLGDVNLQATIQQSSSADAIIAQYQSVIDLLVQLAVTGADGFDPDWAYQTPAYDHELILERECRYFIEAFVNDYLGMNESYAAYLDEFTKIAQNALADATIGFMHRDMQSRNIMLKDNQFYFIDYQGGRLGPVQYDLASLLIDPYVELPKNIQNSLTEFYLQLLSKNLHIDSPKFLKAFKYCSLTRNFQVLGAYGYLSKAKGKTYFERYIPAAVRSLSAGLAGCSNPGFPGLSTLAEKIAKRMTRNS
jgi:NDP-sugar pyrophosphorylase family protein/aminoglycoside/choline kinase family phosphotransferase